METNQTSIGKAALHHGAILGVALIILSLIFHFAGLGFEGWTMFLSWAVMIAYLSYATKNFRDENRGGLLSYGQGLGLGTLMSFIAGLISCLYTIVYMKFINTDFVNQYMEKSYEGMLERGMEEEQISQILSMQEPYIATSTIVMSFVLTLLMGFIFSLIISAVFKRTED
jgi:hypothetical protein